MCHHSNHKEGIDIFDVTGRDDDIKEKCNLSLLSELEIGLASSLNMMLCYVHAGTHLVNTIVSAGHLKLFQLLHKKINFLGD